MAKRKPEDPPAGLAPWMATFSDLMNLLLCFFVLLFSMSSISEEKYNQFVASMSSAFSILDGGATAIGDGILISNGVSQLNELDEYINSTGKNADSETDSDQFEQFDAAGDAKEELFQMVQDVLEEAAGALGIQNVKCVQARAEEFAGEKRESFDGAVSRAVAALPVLTELCLPLVKPGGQFLAMKSVDSNEELNAAGRAVNLLGGRLEKPADYSISGTNVPRRLVIMTKITETQKKYPRTFAKIKKNPL